MLQCLLLSSLVKFLAGEFTLVEPHSCLPAWGYSLCWPKQRGSPKRGREHLLHAFKTKTKEHNSSPIKQAKKKAEALNSGQTLACEHFMPVRLAFGMV